MERPAESAEAGKPDVQADVGHTSVGFAQQEHRTLDPAALKVAVRRFAEGGAEGSNEMCFGDAGKPGQSGNVKRFRIRAIHRIAGPKHPPIDLHYSSSQ